jgi:hypothetical protein
MTGHSRMGKVLFAVGVAVLIALNLCTFVAAYPETYTLTPGINTSGSLLAKDFSAYYIGSWRLWNNPSHIYTLGAVNGAEPIIQPYPEAYKYLPSFLVVISPLLSLGYQQALTAFDVFQFLLLPVVAFMLYRLLGKKGLAVSFVVMAVALLLPFPTQNWGFSPSYYWQWGEGQAKVFSTFLFLLSFYLGSRGKPYLSGIALALGFFDPRFGLLALPLFVMYNRRNFKAAAFSLIASLLFSNMMLLYPGMGSGFVGMVLGSAVSTPLYYYSLIPFFTLVALIAVNYKELVVAFDYYGVLSRFTGAPKEHKWKGYSFRS